MKAQIKLFPLLLLCRSLICLAQTGDSGINGKLDSLFNTVPDFSGVVLIAESGKPVYLKAFGNKNFQTKEPLDANSVFELASVSKQFTAMAIMILKEEGKLNYDDPAEKYIPGLPYPGITIRHLLNHTSGLPDYQNIMDKYWDKIKVAGNEDNIEYLKKYRPEKRFQPGMRYEYSNTGYMLLASIAEKASGKNFIQFCHERIFTPLQMTNTGIRTREEKLKLQNMAWGHIFVKEKQRYIPADSFPEFNYSIWLGNRKGPGRISSTAPDLLKWDRTLYTEKLVQKKTMVEAFTPATLSTGAVSNYGFGWQLEQHPQLGKVVRHSGDNPGYKTHILRYIEANKTIVLLSNNAHEKFEELLKGIERLIAAK